MPILILSFVYSLIFIGTLIYFFLSRSNVTFTYNRILLTYSLLNIVVTTVILPFLLPNLKNRNSILKIIGVINFAVLPTFFLLLFNVFFQIVIARKILLYIGYFFSYVLLIISFWFFLNSIIKDKIVCSVITALIFLSLLSSLFILDVVVERLDEQSYIKEKLISLAVSLTPICTTSYRVFDFDILKEPETYKTSHIAQYYLPAYPQIESVILTYVIISTILLVLNFIIVRLRSK